MKKKRKRIPQSVSKQKKQIKNPNGFHNPFCKKKNRGNGFHNPFPKAKKKKLENHLSNTQTSTQHTFQTISKAGSRQNSEDVHIQTYN